MRQATVTTADSAAADVFSATVDELRASQEQVRSLRPEVQFEDIPAPRSLAPFATAVSATVDAGEDEAASGRFVLLYDPAGQQGWAGPLRVIVYIRADMEPEIVQDPMICEVAWSWLTEALDARTAGYAEPSGTVTRVTTEGFGAKSDEPPARGFELRASWSPVALPGTAPEAGPSFDPGVPGPAAVADHLAAWCAALCSAAGLPPLVVGVTPLRPGGRRRGS